MFLYFDCLCLSDLCCFVFLDFSSFCTLGSVFSYIIQFFITANVLVNCLETKLVLEQQRCHAWESLGDLTFSKLGSESGSISFLQMDKIKKKMMLFLDFVQMILSNLFGSAEIYL